MGAKFCYLHIWKPPRHLVCIVFWLGRGPNGPKMPTHLVPWWLVGWWLWRSGYILQDTYLLYLTKELIEFECECDCEYLFCCQCCWQLIKVVTVVTWISHIYNLDLSYILDGPIQSFPCPVSQSVIHWVIMLLRLDLCDPGVWICWVHANSPCWRWIESSNL